MRRVDAPRADSMEQCHSESLGRSSVYRDGFRWMYVCHLRAMLYIIANDTISGRNVLHFTNVDIAYAYRCTSGIAWRGR